VRALRAFQHPQRARHAGGAAAQHRGGEGQGLAVRMDIYLPIAGMSVNALLIVALGGLVGVLSGMFGVGGGFLTTPLLIFYGIPPSVAVASATTQITGASVSGVMAHMRAAGSTCDGRW
jgi:hypothetical protein